MSTNFYDDSSRFEMLLYFLFHSSRLHSSIHLHIFMTILSHLVKMLLTNTEGNAIVQSFSRRRGLRSKVKRRQQWEKQKNIGDCVSVDEKENAPRMLENTGLGETI